MQSGNDVVAVHSPLRSRRGRKACDACRRLKIKCDGLTPCTHCAAYERACTYNVPYRRPRALAGRARDLEDRLRTVEKLLDAANRGLDLDNSKLEPTRGISRTLQTPESAIRRDNTQAVRGSDVPSGQPSGSTSPPPAEKQHKPQQKPTLNPVIPLPNKDVAHNLLAHALQDACVLHRFVHEPLFYSMVDYIYQAPAEKLIKDHRSALALFYAALALGAFFANRTQEDLTPFAADIRNGAFYFNWAVKFLDLDECQCLVSLQALCFLVIYLQSTGQLDRCYSYVGIALRSAVALHLHRSSANVVNPVEHEIGKQVFWVVWRMDVYSSSMLGIPPMLDIGFVDQSFPEPIEDIQGNTASFAPEHSRLLVASANAHTRLTLIMPKVMRLVKTFKKSVGSSPDLESLIGKVRLVEIEQELQAWYQHLVPEVLPGGETTPQLKRACQLLRIAHAYVQMVLYEPLAQCVSRENGAFIDSPMFDYLMKYSSATRHIVSTGVSIHKSGVANYSSRSTMISTTYSAILSLIVFLLNVPASSNTKGVIFKESLEGRVVLEELSSRSKLANEYIQKLNMIFERFRDGPRPFPLTVPSSPLAATDIEPGTAYSAPLFTGGSSAESLSSQPSIAAPEQYDATWHSVSIPGNLVFESPLPLPYGYAFSDVNPAASVIQPELMDITFPTYQFDLPSATDLMELDYSLPGAQETDPSQTVGRNSTAQGLPPPSTSDAVFPESWSLAASIPYPETMLSRPISIGRPQESTESMPHMGWTLPDVDDAICSFGAVEPTAEQLLDSILDVEMD